MLPPERRAEFHIAHTLATDTNDLGVLHPLLRVLGERLGRRLRQSGLVARRLMVEATYNDYTTISRSVALHAAALDAELWDGARRGFTSGQLPPSSRARGVTHARSIGNQGVTTGLVRDLSINTNAAKRALLSAAIGAFNAPWIASIPATESRALSHGSTRALTR